MNDAASWRERFSFSAVCRLSIGIVLLVAGLLKIGSPWALAESLANYRLLPAAGNQILAVLLPWWEVTCGILLIAGLWERACGLLAAGLFGAFAVATAIALLRNLDIQCGCFGTAAAGRIGFRTILLDVVAMSLSVALVLGKKERTSLTTR